MSAKSGEDPSRGGAEALRAAAHDLGNLAYRLSFLTESLKSQILDPGHRAEALALLEDTTARLQQIARRVREAAPDV